ncbi:MAG: hypothetical protein M1275_03790, partial [Patescibacteria group bacterium]|nr:hypothetical protein [Patescibacteria group bacterium]
FDEILLEAEQLRADALSGAMKTEGDFKRAGREELDELNGPEVDEKFRNWAHNMEKRLGMGKRT